MTRRTAFAVLALVLAPVVVAACDVEESAPGEIHSEATTATGTTVAEPEVAPELEQAVRQAESYLGFTSFAPSGLVEQLKFEGYPPETAQAAVDSLTVDWDEQARLKAADYLDFSAFSCQGLVDQLAFEGFTSEQAQQGAASTGIC
jgi:hypothetical protein